MILLKYWDTSIMKQKIPSPTIDTTRRVALSLPAYRYVPGLLPHPFRSEKGHMYHGTPMFAEGDVWEENEQFLYGADLFDARFLWEAHENWEHCWHRSEGAQHKCIQGLIQMAASLLKHHMGEESPRDRLLASAKSKLQRASEVGWDFSRLVEDTHCFFQGGDWPLLGAEFPKK
jgi:hypothetical protein